MRVAVEAGDREPCVGGVSGASAGKKSAPPIPAVLLAEIQKGFFQPVSEPLSWGGREGGQAGKQAVGEARE